MIAQVRRIVARAARSLQRRIVASAQAAACYWVVDACYLSDVDGLGIENTLSARNRSPSCCCRHRLPGIKWIEDRRRELAVARRYQSAWGLKAEKRRRKQKADTGVDTDKKRLAGERDGPAGRTVGVQSAGVIVNNLRRRQFHLKIHDFLLFCRSRPRPVSLAVALGAGNTPVLLPKSVEAHDLYLKGLYFWNKRTVTSFQQAIEYFQQATKANPNHAAAYAGLANSYTLLSAYTPVSATLYMPQARAAALRSLELDENLAEAHTALALIVQNQDWDWQTSEREFRRAIELNPDYATGHQWYAEHLMWRGRFSEALRESERARHLDPLSLIIASDYGAILYFSRQYDPAIEQLRSVLQRYPNFGPAVGLLVRAYAEKGILMQALAHAETWGRIYGEGPVYWSLRAYAYGRAGHPDLARRELKKLEELSRHEQLDPATMIWAHLGVSDKEEALADLEKAYSQHFNILTTLKVDLRPSTKRSAFPGPSPPRRLGELSQTGPVLAKKRAKLRMFTKLCRLNVLQNAGAKRVR